jgi:hypothetical protein
LPRTSVERHQKLLEIGKTFSRKGFCSLFQTHKHEKTGTRGVYMSVGEGMQLFLEVDGMLTQVFTVKQTSYHVKYSVRTLHQWIDEGKLIAYKVANMLLIPESEINRIRWRDNPPPHLPIYR